tara:strand:+ start:6934 stop:7116 length:183 start_codon:yes stop_codon:yes gene_type:complete
MKPKEKEILDDLKAFIDEKLFTDEFETCLAVVSQDASDVLMSGENTPRMSAGSHGKILLR